MAPKKNKRLGVAWGIVVKDASGKVIENIEGENSILTNFLAAVFNHPFTLDTFYTLDIYGSSRVHTLSTNAENSYGWVNHDDHNDSHYYRQETGGLNCDATEGSVVTGIVVGTGTTEVVASDYALESIIGHGSSTGQLYYAAGLVEGLSVNEQRAEVNITRRFTNNTEADISISEIGLYGRVTNASTGTYYLCLFRDIVGPFVVPAGAVAEVKYTYYTTV